MTSTTAAGSSIAISTGTPATLDRAGYAALSYDEIGFVDKIGTIGKVFGKTEFQALRRAKDKLKGSVDYGALTPSMAYDETDAGQVTLRAAADDKTTRLYVFRLTVATGEIRYFRGRVFGAPEGIEGADAVVMTTATIEICTPHVKVAATATPVPSFTTQPSISPSSGAVGTTFTANDGNASNATSYTRRWLLGTTAIGTGTTVTPNAAGSLTLEVTANGPGGSATATSAAATVTATPTPTPSTARMQATDRSAMPQATANVVNSSSNTQIGDQMSLVMLRDETELVVTEGNFYAASAAAASLNGLSAVTYRRAFYDGTTYYPLTSGGSRDLTVQPGQTASWDPVAITVKKGQSLVLISLKTFASAPANFPGSTVPFSNARDLSEAGTALTDRTTSGGFTAATRVSTTAILPPIAIRGALRAKGVSVCVIGDSIPTAGASDADTNRAERGYAQRGFAAAGIPFVVSGQTSLKAADVVANATVLGQYLQPAVSAGVSHIYLALGINDAQTRTAAQIYADLQSIASAAKAAISGVKVVLATLTPKTNAANNGQSGSDTTTWATRLSLNTMIRDNNGVGDGYFDAAAAMQSSGDANLWRSDLLTATTISLADGGINNLSGDLVETDIGLVVQTGGSNGQPATAVSIRGSQGGAFLVAPTSPALEEMRQNSGTVYAATTGSGLKVNVTATGAVAVPTDGLHPSPGMHSYLKQLLRNAIPSLFTLSGTSMNLASYGVTDWDPGIGVKRVSANSYAPSKEYADLLAEFRAATTVQTYFVDPVNGLDANNGATGAPWQRVHTAWTQAPSGAATVEIIVRPPASRILWGARGMTNGSVATKNIIMRAEDGGELIVAGGTNNVAPTWTDNGDGTFTCSSGVTNTVVSVPMDWSPQARSETIDGDGRPFAQTITASALDAAGRAALQPGQAHKNSATGTNDLTIRPFGNRALSVWKDYVTPGMQPGSNFRVALFDSTPDSLKFWLSRIKPCGGTPFAFQNQRTSVGGRGEIYTDRCGVFSSASPQNGQAVVGAWRVINFDPTSDAIGEDAYNAHDGTNGNAAWTNGSAWVVHVRPKTLTVGLNASGVSNSDTGHGTCRGLTIMPQYRGGNGRPYAWINTSATLCFGGSIGPSTRTTAQGYFETVSAGNTAKMTLVETTVAASPNGNLDISADAGASVKCYGMTQGALRISGDVTFQALA